MSTGTRRAPLERLADAVGIVPRYMDQTGTECRETTPETMVALLATMGIDASSDAAVEAALRALQTEARRELIAPVRVVEIQDDTTARHLSLRLASPPSAGTRWIVELETERGGTTRETGRWPGGRRAELALPWSGYPELGYHHVRLTLSSGTRERLGEQLLIVVPSRCVMPRALLDERRAFGFVANLYTVRSERNWGVGDVTDLEELVGWGGEVGAAFVGLNPLHALLNRGEHISPYSPVSRLFRNPLYLDVEAIPELRLVPNVAQRLERPELQAELNALRETPHVHYERVMALKWPVLEELHRAFVERERASGSARAREYEEFLAAHDPELTRFATWTAIEQGLGARSQGPGTRGEGQGGGGGDWRRWPREFQSPDSDAVRRFQGEHAPEVDLHRWVQFELDRQLAAAAARAKQAGMPIGLYQDLAIGSSPGGADTWAMPRLFVDNASIGVPPDPYSAAGQNWGLPPIDPRALRRDCYRYFVRLVRSGFRHAGALRIDHVMGLFRLFWIPKGLTGREGAFVRYPANDLLGILALESVRHRAIVVGEDLGTIPEEVPEALRKWGVLSSKVFYFERDNRGGFKEAAQYEALALATANTHDMATLAGFWEGRDVELRAKVGLIESEAAAARARDERERDKGALLERLAADGVLPSPRAPGEPAALRGAIHDFLCRTPSSLVGLALDDLAGEPDAVNLPGVGPDRHPSWTRKMSLTIEEMRESEDVRAALRCEDRASGERAQGGTE